MRNMTKNSWRRSLVLTFCCLAICLSLIASPLNQLRTRAQGKRASSVADKTIHQGERIETKDFDVVRLNDSGAGGDMKGRDTLIPHTPFVGTSQGEESEPNDTFGTADALTGSEGKIRGQSFPTATDPDWYSFTAAAGSKVYATVMTSASAQGADAVLEVIAPDGTTVLELDDEDGTFGGSSPSIAGTNLVAGGTYFFRVTNFSTTSFIVPYDLYFAVRSIAPPAETEPNNNGTPQVIPASEYVSGTVDPVGDTDTFSFTAAAGETIFLSLDLDPERDVTTFNGRIGMGLFGTPATFVVTGDSGAFDTIDSEAFLITVKTAGSYHE